MSAPNPSETLSSGTTFRESTLHDIKLTSTAEGHALYQPQGRQIHRKRLQWLLPPSQVNGQTTPFRLFNAQFARPGRDWSGKRGTQNRKLKKVDCRLPASAAPRKNLRAMRAFSSFTAACAAAMMPHAVVRTGSQTLAPTHDITRLLGIARAA